MAKFNEILSGRFNRALQKMLSMKGGPPSAQLATEIGTQFQFPLGVEFRNLESWFRYGAAPGLPAVAAANAVFRFRNPAGSNVVAVVEKLAFPGLNLAPYQVERRAMHSDLGVIV